MGQDGPGHRDRPEEQHLQQRPQLGQVELLDRADAAAPRVVDDDVDATELGHGPGHDRGDLSGVDDSPSRSARSNAVSACACSTATPAEPGSPRPAARSCPRPAPSSTGPTPGSPLSAAAPPAWAWPSSP